jgi:hypothetical protein
MTRDEREDAALHDLGRATNWAPPSPGLFVRPWAQVNCQAGDPSTRTHSRSAASASSKIAAAALGLPIRYTSAAAVWSRQMVPIPLRVRMAKARSSVAVRGIIGAIYAKKS